MELDRWSSRCDGRSGSSDDGLVGDPLVHLVDDLPHGLEVAELDVEGSDPVRCDAVGDVPDHAHLGLDGERHLASSRVRRSVEPENDLVSRCGVVIVSSSDVGCVKRAESHVGPDEKRD